MAQHNGLPSNAYSLGGQRHDGDGSPAQTSATHVGNSTAQLPNVDLSFLANYPPDQIAAIGQLFLSGAMRLPPSVPAQQSQVAVQQDTHTIKPPPQASTLELEEGEISDAPDAPDRVTIAAHSAGSASSQPFATARKRRSQSPLEQPPRKRSLSPSFYARQQRQIESFITVMYENGYGFDQVKNHVTDQDGLTALYQKLSLPLVSKNVKVDPALPQLSLASKPSYVENKAHLSNPGSPAIAAKRVTQASAAQDRQAYLARLQAAKSKKTETSTTALAAATSRDSSTRAVVSTANLSNSADTQTATKPVKKGLDAEKKELLRQRLAALKAAQASKERAEQDKAAATVREVDHFLSALAHDSGSSQQGNLTSPPSDSQIASPPQSRPPLDSDALRYHSLVISVSDNEQSESELDDDSSGEDNTGGVSVAQATSLHRNDLPISTSQPSGIANSRQPTSASDISDASTPPVLAAKTLDDLEALKKRLAEAEMRKRARMNGQTPQSVATPAAGDPVTTFKAVQGLASVVDQQGTDSPAAVDDAEHASGIEQPHAHAMHGSTFPASDQGHQANVESDIDMDSSDFEAMYDAPNTTTAAPLPQAIVQQQPGIEDEDSDWTGTASEGEYDAKPTKQAVSTLANEDGGQLHQPYDSSSIPLPSPSRSQDADSVSDSCSMEISDEPASQDSDNMSSADERPAAALLEHALAPDLHQPAYTDSGPAVVREAGDLDANKQAAAHQVTRFTPYESPLRALKRYRFHPHLVQKIAEPWKSLTWTHRGEPMDVLQPVDNQQVCNQHDRLGFHVHWEELSLQGIAYLADLAWNPGWTDAEREAWSAEMAKAAEEQAEIRDLNHEMLVTRSEEIMVKHALAWAEQSLKQSCQELG